MTIIAGSFPHQIHIRRKTEGKDAWGTPLPKAWENLTAKPIWANVRFLSGSETIKAGADVSIVRASVRIRWRVGITAGMQVVFGGQVLDIDAVLPGVGRQHVDLACTLVSVPDEPEAPAPDPEPDPGDGGGGWGGGWG